MLVEEYTIVPVAWSAADKWPMKKTFRPLQQNQYIHIDCFLIPNLNSPLLEIKEQIHAFTPTKHYA